MRHFKIAILVVLVVIILLSGCVPRSTGPTEVGVRTRKVAIFARKGVEEKAYPPGATYFFLPVINDWHTFDIKLQNMEMTLLPKKGDRKGRDDLVFKTIDGNDISLDVIISYRIIPEKAPYILQYVAENDEMLKEKIIRTVARSKPRDIFGELTSEEFYIAQKRQEKAEKAKKELNRILNPYGVIVEKVSTKDYRFNPQYQKAIEDRKVADQLAEKYKSAARAAEEEYKAKLEEAQGEVNKMIAAADGEYLKTRLEADAYYEKQALLAKAIITEGKAEAEGVKKMVAALSSEGGDIMIKLKLAEALSGKKIILLPVSQGGIDIKTMDMNKLLELFGVKSLSSERK